MNILQKRIRYPESRPFQLHHKWSLSNGTISKLVNFIGFVVMPDKNKSDDNNRFKFL